MAGSTLRVMATFLVKPGEIDAFKALMDGVREPTRAEPGCLAYHLLQSDDDPVHFVFTEEWRSEIDLAAHLAAPHIAAIANQVDRVLACPPMIHRFRAIW